MTKIIDLTKKVENALEEIRPFLINDGGNVELISIKNNIVEVRFLGACDSCSINKMTLKNGIEAVVIRHVPQIIAVVAIG